MFIHYTEIITSESELRPFFKSLCIILKNCKGIKERNKQFLLKQSDIYPIFYSFRAAW